MDPRAQSLRLLTASASRREFIRVSALATAAMASGRGLFADEPAPKARIAITLDLEMARNFPKWEDTHWDFDKGNLTEETKNYAVEAARRVKARGGVIHFFLVGRALEQANVDWLKEIAAMGHPIGNHTYDHVNLLAKTPEETQFRFQRAPWLVAGKTVAEVLRENVRLTNAALKSRLQLEPAGFRAPGGFPDGLADREDLQRLLIEQGFRWVSAKYPPHPNSKPGEEPSADLLRAIVRAQRAAQPFVYPTGLIEIPMAPISDVGAFRNGRWKLEHFLQAIRLSVASAIEHRAVFAFLGHPAVLSAVDPDFRAIELICELVKGAGPLAEIVDLNRVALGAR